ncbi:hypothetical protein PMZ80_010304 [Knufia obscura]|uniref:Uncharacterized protein n=2 Tax=Knufia TaxID=430999 RepID=A0AAN8EQH1_9EURO|nr:hypothetical protein PMZ80_010304 [Knufia obscura]KAK5951811.1 hypothetical protein OHC33_007103 [Knufia fluminis]
MVYDEGDSGVYHNPSTPLRNTDEARTFSPDNITESSSDSAESLVTPLRNTDEARTFSPDNITESSSDSAKSVDEDYDYLFEGEPDFTAQFSPPDMRDEDVDALTAFNGSEAAVTNTHLSANEIWGEQQGEPMMSGALQHDGYRDERATEQDYSPSVSDSEIEDEASASAWVALQSDKRPEYHHDDPSRKPGSSSKSYIRGSLDFDDYKVTRPASGTTAEPQTMGKHPSIPSNRQRVERERRNLLIYDPRGSFGLNRNAHRETTPTESELERDDFQFNKVIEKIKSKHTRQALQNVDPTLSRQELFRIYRRAIEEEGDDVELYRPHTPALEYDSDVLDASGGDDYGEDVSPCDDGEPRGFRRKSSYSRPSRAAERNDSRQQHLSETRNPSAEAAHQSLMHSKPYLSEITPTEAQGHHPSVIPRSPQRSSSRASSLSSETRLKSRSRTPEPQALTEEALVRKDKETSSSSLGNPVLPAPVNEPPSSPFRLPTEPASSTVQSSPLRKAYDSMDAASTRAMIGSPTPTPSQAVSRPDTPRPSFSTQHTGQRSEVEDYSFSQRHLQPAQIARSNTPSPSMVRDVDMLDTPHIESPTPTKESSNVQSASVTLPPPLYVMDSTLGAQASQNSLRITASSTVAPPMHPDARMMALSSDIGSAVNSSVANAFSSSSSAANLGITSQNSPLQPLPGLSLQQTLANVLASVSQAQPSAEDSSPEVSPKTQSQSKSTTPYLDEPWQEPVRALDNLSQSPSRPMSPLKRSSQQSQRKSQATEQPPSKKPSDPFASNNDMISFPPPTGSPPLSPLTGIAGQIYQSKRPQRKATTPGRLARRAVTGTRAVSAKSPGKAKTQTGDAAEGSAQTSGKRSKSTHIGVQGDGAKVTKTRTPSRKVSTRTSKKKATASEDIPDVPSLPVDMDIDVPTESESPSPKKKQPAKAPSTPSRRTPKQQKNETPQAMDVDKTEPQATPDALEQLEREQREAADESSGQGQETPAKRRTMPSRKKAAANVDATPKTPPRSTPRRKNVGMPQDMDVDSLQDHPGSGRRTTTRSGTLSNPLSESVSEPTAQKPHPPTKSTPTKRKPTPSRKKQDADEAQVPKTPSRTPRKKKDDASGERLTPQSAERAKQRQTPTRRSPRLLEKAKRERDAEIEFERGHSVM